MSWKKTPDNHALVTRFTKRAFDWWWFLKKRVVRLVQDWDIFLQDGMVDVLEKNVRQSCTCYALDKTGVRLVVVFTKRTARLVHDWDIFLQDGMVDALEKTVRISRCPGWPGLETRNELKPPVR